MRMAESVICKMPTYIEFCEEHNFLTKNGRPQATAESIYAFITNNPDYKEEHTALEDVEIETEIMQYCYRQHKPMNKVLYSNEPNPNRPQTSLELIWRS